ncbi:MAG: hypothetical protein WDZ29_08010 [Balneolaceae bacterium]
MITTAAYLQSTTTPFEGFRKEVRRNERIMPMAVVTLALLLFVINSIFVNGTDLLLQLILPLVLISGILNLILIIR